MNRKVSPILLAFILLLPVVAVAQPACKVNVNSATAEQLGLLIRTGPVLTERIIAARPLDAVKLDEVKGVGVKWLEYNAAHVTYAGETTCKLKLSAPKAEPALK